MKLENLQKAIESHTGTFHCVRLHDSALTKEVVFRHEFDAPIPLPKNLQVDKLADFFETFSRLVLYHDPISDDAAFVIVSPDQWASLDSEFRPWLECVDENDEEQADLLPSWIGDCLVFGEVPRSGNYLLMPLSGEKRGFVYEFEHDGFEFIEYASDIEQFVYRFLDPSPSALTEMASHMRFVEGDDYGTQWWIDEMRDNRGNVVRTHV